MYELSSWPECLPGICANVVDNTLQDLCKRFVMCFAFYVDWFSFIQNF